MLEVVKPGAFSTIQDAGRYGFQRYGVIVSGVMDEVAFRMGNALLQQHNAAAIEMTLIGGTYRFHVATTIALTGGQSQARLNGQACPLYCAIAVKAGDVLTIGAIQQGVRQYLHVAGGIQVPVVMNSRSTYSKAGIGGFEGRALQAGDRLPIKSCQKQFVSRHIQPASFYLDAPIRIIVGTEWTRLGVPIQQAFLQTAYTISLQADRMGYRLLPKQPIVVEQPFQLLSEAVSFGTVQLPPNGEPIVLMADRQTTGGYPKIAQVIAADLPRLAQLAPQMPITFEVVTLEQAEALWIAQQQQLRLFELLLAQA